LRTVLAELRELAVLAVGSLRFRPGAAGAVESLSLVEQAQSADRTAGAHLLDATQQRNRHARNAGRPLLGLVDLEPGLVDVFGRRVTCHALIVRRCSLSREPGVPLSARSRTVTASSKAPTPTSAHARACSPADVTCGPEHKAISVDAAI